MDQAASPSGINTQITDAVTQRNVKVIGEAPAQAVATIYTALAHAISILFQNAVAAQQQAQQLATASLAEGVARLYAHSSAAGDGAQRPETNMSQGNEEPRALAAGLNNVAEAPTIASRAAAQPDDSQPQPDADPATLVERLRAEIEAERDRHPVYSGISQQVEQAIKLSNQQVLGSAGEVAYAQRACTEAFVAGLRQVSDAQHRQRMQLQQAAATAVCLEAMLKSPEHAGDYAELLQIIKHLV
ncbi:MULTISPECIES: RebB family R body protein [unclassified Lysobacter]|uniref:RebB family R body protein n=1 Tax=unclassified Lysobacter TaxID=2635362 RepID=UPI001BE66055|nr:MULTISPECIES: RebB family R body protein [unclassified Lysobacter]MBT2749130.1 RebB family R body protein [Lysobacter sp. ISL-42]MBT2753276.1 RebB family R body protein [Lysobacter sp. ISL-50]MBT2776549.1 RebB family R body protein [Lysobacter sp. ISL-54]MBT2783266.1 RebB family R body protein [Lysobacter sp. ISL-52]